VYTILCTQKLRDRLTDPLSEVADDPPTALGNWYATALFWKPQLALFVNEKTLLPVLMPLAPAASLARRFPAQLALVLEAHGVAPAFIARETGAMGKAGIAKTASRSIVGTMNDFVHMLECAKEDGDALDPVDLSLWLAETLCGGAAKYRIPGKMLIDLVRATSG
jgi:hypothetical protein